MMNGSKTENVHISEAIIAKDVYSMQVFKHLVTNCHLPDNGNFDPLKLAFVKSRGGLFRFSERP